ncbi:MAG: hypothetical protein ACQERZ_05255 [Fusobacteriota bacterium]
MLVISSALGILYMFFLWTKRITAIIKFSKEIIELKNIKINTKAVAENLFMMVLDIILFFLVTLMLGSSVFGIQVAIIINIVSSVVMKKVLHYSYNQIN